MTELVNLPVMYAVASDKNYAMFLDNVYRHEWTFNSDPFSVTMWGDQIAFYVWSGADLPALRQQ